MPDALTAALAAVARAEALLTILDGEHTPDQPYPRLRGVRHELATARDGLKNLGADLTVARGGKVRADAPETSRAAARTISTRSGSQRHLILARIARAAQGMTDAELQFILNLSGNSQRPRRLELKEAGYVRVMTRADIERHGSDGVPVTRTNPVTGQACEVWMVTELGQSALAKLSAGQYV